MTLDPPTAYRTRLGRLLRASRLRLDIPLEEMAPLLASRAGLIGLEARHLAAWEKGSATAPVIPAVALLAAFDLAGVDEAGELEGTALTLAGLAAIAESLAGLRVLVDDPVALMRRAERLLGRVAS